MPQDERWECKNARKSKKERGENVRKNERKRKTERQKMEKLFHIRSYLFFFLLRGSIGKKMNVTVG